MGSLLGLFKSTVLNTSSAVYFLPIAFLSNNYLYLYIYAWHQLTCVTAYFRISKKFLHQQRQRQHWCSWILKIIRHWSLYPTFKKNPRKIFLSNIVTHISSLQIVCMAAKWYVAGGCSWLLLTPQIFNLPPSLSACFPLLVDLQVKLFIHSSLVGVHGGNASQSSVLRLRWGEEMF